ncbi:MAG: ATP-binding protein [Firmicutes bacterium]|jgi:signal transduction histidine kinase|nr:ATP-binding protein [Bacillota bacterium]
MIRDYGKVQGIVCELIANSVQARAKKIEATIEDLGTELRIEVKDDGTGMNPAQLEAAQARLALPRRHEIQDYYGGLAGGGAGGTGLALVGMMTDRSEVHSVPGQGTAVVVYRVKD